MLQITPPPALRTSGIARRVTSTSPKTFVSNISRHSSSGVSSTGRCSRSTPAWLTSTRRPSGRRIVSARVTSSASTRSRPPRACASSGRPAPAWASRIVATTSNPRRASSSAIARPMPRLAPVTAAIPAGSMLPPVPMAASVYGRRVGNVATRPRDDVFAAMSDVVLAIAGELRLDAVLDRLVHAARELVDARYAALGIPDEDGTEFDQFLHAGMSDDLVAELGPLPRTHGMLGAMLSDPRPFRTDDITTDARFRGWWPDAHPRMRSFLGVPIVAKGDIIGAFYLTEKIGAPAAFDDRDEKVISVLAAHAAIAIENARLFEASRELSVIEERNRLARELHDAMTQNLFSLALTAEAASQLVRADPARAEAEIDRVRALARDTQAELRSLIFELRPPQLERDGLVATIGKDLEVLGRAHGLKTDLRVHGAPGLDSAVEVELYRIVQEALNNVVRHAQADTVEVEIEARDARVSITVRDDGVGFDPGARAIRERRLGLTSMRERAERLGGAFRVE